jgi:hypothetical protein
MESRSVAGQHRVSPPGISRSRPPRHACPLTLCPSTHVLQPNTFMRCFKTERVWGAESFGGKCVCASWGYAARWLRCSAPMKTAAPGSGCTRGACNGTVFGGIDFLNSGARTGVRARASCLIFLVEASQSARHNWKKEHLMSRSHRVVRTDGGLSGYRCGEARKRALPAKEAHA